MWNFQIDLNCVQEILYTVHYQILNDLLEHCDSAFRWLAMHVGYVQCKQCCCDHHSLLVINVSVYIEEEAERETENAVGRNCML